MNNELAEVFRPYLCKRFKHYIADFMMTGQKKGKLQSMSSTSAMRTDGSKDALPLSTGLSFSALVLSSLNPFLSSLYLVLSPPKPLLLIPCSFYSFVPVLSTRPFLLVLVLFSLALVLSSLAPVLSSFALVLSSFALALSSSFLDHFPPKL